jgi:hypothetical protein
MSRTETRAEDATLAGAAAESERRPGLRAVGGTVGRLAGPIVARHGGGVLARLKAEWLAIISPELAAATWPAGLSRDGALKLRVAPERALEVQHRTPLVIERINLFLGREAVVRIVLEQGPLPLHAPARSASEAPIPVEEMRALEGRLAAVSDPELRQALARFGRGVLAAPRRDR